MDIIQIIEDKATKIRTLVSISNLEQALKLLMQFAFEYDKSSLNKTLVLNSSYLRFKNEKERGILYRETIDVTVSRIKSNILEYNDAITKNANHNYKNKLLEDVKIEREVILQASKIEKHYRNTDFHFQLPELTLRSGEITGLVGKNATGKTTLLRILAGDLAHDKGRLQYPKFNKSKRLWWHRIKRHIAYVPQELPVWNGDLEQNLAYRAAQRGIKGADNREATEYIIPRLGLVEHIGKSWQQLSGGYKLRFALAGALICRPQLLIIDEPLSHLDVNTRLIVINDLRNIADSLPYPLSIIISSQHIHEIETVADQLLFMRGGETENLNYDHYADRKHNVYELYSTDYTQLPTAFADIEITNLRQNTTTYIITTPTNVTAKDILQALHQHRITIHYFRDISQSVKTKFYEKTT